jgi:hypothetical protein
MLAGAMDGQKVMGAGVGYAGPDAAFDAAALKKADSLLDRLQVIAAAASKGPDAIIPFKVGTAYMLAPETRDEVVTDFSHISPYAAMSSTTVMDFALTSLTEAQIRLLGSDAGVAVADISPDARATLAYLFRPPLRMPHGTGQSDPLDWARVRLRARLRANGVAL